MNTSLKTASRTREINACRSSLCIYTRTPQTRISTSARAGLCESGRLENRINTGLDNSTNKYRASGCDPHKHWARDRSQTRINTRIQGPRGFGSFSGGSGGTVNCGLGKSV